jgi:protein-S-isoprenylcysteine O-methyltransferase Ste14
MLSVSIILLAMAAWGAFHSLTASFIAKAHASALLGPPVANRLYRFGYNVVSVVTFLPVMALVGLLPDQPLYQFPAWLTLFTAPIQLLSALAALLALWQVDLFHFLGLRQIVEGEAESKTPPKLYTGGAYGWVRHPLYFFSLVILWLTPIMTLNILAFNLGATAYFYIGSIFEERKLVAEFGDEYREHQRKVPRLFPWPRWNR